MSAAGVLNSMSFLSLAFGNGDQWKTKSIDVFSSFTPTGRNAQTDPCSSLHNIGVSVGVKWAYCRHVQSGSFLTYMFSQEIDAAIPSPCLFSRSTPMSTSYTMRWGDERKKRKKRWETGECLLYNRNGCLISNLRQELRTAWYCSYIIGKMRKERVWFILPATVRDFWFFRNGRSP